MTKIQEKYFDWAASALPDAAILEDALKLNLEKCANPSSIHTPGKEAEAVLENARLKCAEVLNVPAESIYFTSGGTESSQIPILSVLNRPKRGEILLSSIEHSAVREQAKILEKCGWKINFIHSDKNGIITPEAVVNSLTPETVLVCVMAVNNETGAVQPIYEIADAITEFSGSKRRPKFHTDCVQAAGKIPLNLSYKGISSAALSAHKIYGPRGIGILYLSEQIEPFLKGGGQEKGIRSGTENVYGAWAFSKCLEKYFIKKENTFSFSRYKMQIDYTKDFLKKISLIKGCTVIPENRLYNENNYSPWIVQASFKNIPGQVMLRSLDQNGFYISTGSACSSGKYNRPVLDAMGILPEVSNNAVRFSFGSFTTKEAMDELVQVLLKTVEKFG